MARARRFKKNWNRKYLVTIGVIYVSSFYYAF
jgi:hypothetical protein